MFIAVILSWIVIGLVIGFVASKVVNLRGDDIKLGLGAAVGGAILAGVVYSFASGIGLTQWTLWSVATAAIGATVAVVAWHLIRSRTISHDRFTARRSY